MRLLTVIGARPQFIKCAPVSKAIRMKNDETSGGLGRITEILVHTGQHYDYMMSKVFFNELGIPEPDYNLGVGSGSHGQQTGEMLRKIEEILLKEKPDVLMVYGDTNTTLAGSLAASKLHVPVVHIEAGLRSHNKKMPEEVNRILTDHVSSLLFCPTRTAVANLVKEGFGNVLNDGRLVEAVASSSTVDFYPLPLVLNVGDVMFDAMLMSMDIAKRKSDIDSLTSAKGIDRYCLATVHRAENTDSPIRFGGIVNAFMKIAREIPVIWPVHPRTRKLLDANHPELWKHDGLLITKPVSYFDMLMLEKNASLILTDSGGVQKEAYWLKVPCLTLRGETEWVETVESGCNRLTAVDESSIVEVFRSSLDRRGNYEDCIYGKGDTSIKLVSFLQHCRL